MPVEVEPVLEVAAEVAIDMVVVSVNPTVPVVAVGPVVMTSVVPVSVPVVVVVAAAVAVGQEHAIGSVSMKFSYISRLMVINNNSS